MTILRCNSHRARQKLEHWYSSHKLRCYIYWENLWHDKSKGYFILPDDDLLAQALMIKGITKARDQDESHYSPCW